MLVLLGVVFAAGVMFGRQLATGAMQGPAKPGDPLAAIDAKEKTRTGESVTGTGEIPPSKPDALTFQKELTKPADAKDKPDKDVKVAKIDKADKADKPDKADKADKGDKADQGDKAGKPDTATEPKPAKDDAVAKADKGDKTEKPPVKVAKVDPTEKKEERKEGLSAAFDKATGKADAAGAFTLQLASFPTKWEAEKLVGKLAAKGLSAFVVEADLPNKGHVFRVRVGNYPTRAEAEEGLKNFKKKSALPAIISGH
jgi:cell division septation protein DedD